jgi:transcriptional regulator with XRE-family HTH domain
MTGQELKVARKAKGWNQDELAARLGVTQAYVSMVEKGRRLLPYGMARRAAELLQAPPTALPLADSDERISAFSEDERLAGELAALGYPAFSHLRRRSRRNPAEVLLRALNQNDLDSRVVEGLPWLAAKYADLDWDWTVRNAKLADRQNRLGFVATMAGKLAEASGQDDRTRRLKEYVAVLDRSRLVREDTLCCDSLTETERNWLKDTRSEDARHWNLLTGMRPEHLEHAGF